MDAEQMTFETMTDLYGKVGFTPIIEHLLDYHGLDMILSRAVAVCGMRAGLAQAEPDAQKFWTDARAIFDEALKKAYRLERPHGGRAAFDGKRSSLQILAATAADAEIEVQVSGASSNMVHSVEKDALEAGLACGGVVSGYKRWYFSIVGPRKKVLGIVGGLDKEVFTVSQVKNLMEVLDQI